MTNNHRPNKGDVLLLVGTRKGMFVFSADERRADWKMLGTFWPGSDVFHVVYDVRGDGKLWVARNDPVFGSEIHQSSDFGRTWQSSRTGPQIVSNSSIKLNRLWHVTPGREDEPDVVYLGAEPATLFKSEDAGETWDEVEGITLHPTRDRW